MASRLPTCPGMSVRCHRFHCPPPRVNCIYSRTSNPGNHIELVMTHWRDLHMLYFQTNDGFQVNRPCGVLRRPSHPLEKSSPGNIRNEWMNESGAVCAPYKLEGRQSSRWNRSGDSGNCIPPLCVEFNRCVAKIFVVTARAAFLYRDGGVAGADQGFWSRGSRGVLTPRGALSPKFAQHRWFSLHIAWKLHDFEEILGARGSGPPGPPWIRCCVVQFLGMQNEAWGVCSWFSRVTCIGTRFPMMTPNTVVLFANRARKQCCFLAFGARKLSFKSNLFCPADSFELWSGFFSKKKNGSVFALWIEKTEKEFCSFCAGFKITRRELRGHHCNWLFNEQKNATLFFNLWCIFLYRKVYLTPSVYVYSPPVVCPHGWMENRDQVVMT